MSVYRDTNATVVFEHPHPGPLTADVYREGIALPVYSTTVGITPTGGRYSLELPWQATEFDGNLRIEWTAENFKRLQYVEVRAAIVPLSRLKTAFGDEHWAQADLEELENNVRLIIEGYTGQKFTYEIGTKRIVGTGEKKLSLSSRLHRLYAVTTSGPVAYFAVSNDGWHISVSNKNWLTTKEMPPEDVGTEVWTGVKGVIHVPDSYWRKFRAGQEYIIEGEWGYPVVPEDVQEAALLLAADFGSGENLYRDRYLEAIKSGDWNLTYSGGAFRGTGNVRADQLLDKYRRQGMVII